MRLLALLLALAATPAASQEGGAPGPKPWEQASRDGFGALAIATGAYDDFMRAWNGPTPPELPSTSIAERGRPVHFMLLFHGCRAGPDGNCSVTADFAILTPDGRPYGETMRTAAVWRGPALGSASLRLAETGPALIVEPEDPAGTWTMRASVTDHVRGVTVVVEARLSVQTPPVRTPSA